MGAKRRWSAAAAIAILAGAAAYWLLIRNDEPANADAPPASPAVVVEAAAVSVAPLDRELNAIGTLRSEDSIVLRPELAGRVVSLGFQEGQPVRKGQVLVGLDASILEAELAQAEASLALSKANYQRAAELLSRGTASQRTSDENLSKMRMDEASVALARARLAKTRIAAPYGGVAGLRRVAVGDYVSPGQELVTLDVIDPIKLEFRVPEIYLAEVRNGQDVSFETDALPGRTFHGTVYAIDPQVDVSGRSLAVRARADNPDSLLKPGLFVHASLLLARRKDAMMIPEEAIIPQGDDNFAFRIVDGKAVLTKLQTGLRRAGVVEVVSGLQPSDVVVTAGQIKLRDGAPVTVRARPAE
ncbi:MAG: efflux RND transporter periplasmic adaptor subunit [Alphaproteobacteria bacterium]|nr:efflux RND transporter periplasmic adaptor subunit [Alphaproteobacteria bacterium]